MKTIIEPFKIKSVERINFTTRKQRESIIADAHFNLFSVKSDDVIIDLLTDSGTSAMSNEQWAGIMTGDESYAGSPSFYHFRKAVYELTQMEHIIPTHQGRAAEKILFSILGGKGKFVVSNTLFDTTRANVEFSGATGVDLLEQNTANGSEDFKGNLDTDAFEQFIAQHGAENIPACMLTVTNNSGGGQPVSLENARKTAAICRKHNIMFLIDACRFAENAWFIKQRETGYSNKTVKQIAVEMFSLADGCTMSAKKDAFANIGGFLALHNGKLADECRNLLILTEGFTTYGGLAGRDLEAIAIGLNEVVDEHYLQYRISSINYLTQKIHHAGVPVMLPAGGHAVYLNAKEFLPHIPSNEYPGQALACALYVHAGIRSVEIGSLMFGKYGQNGKLIPAPRELVRLAIPRRVYTQSHMDYVAEAIIEVIAEKNKINGLKIVEEAPILRHFTAKLKQI